MIDRTRCMRNNSSLANLFSSEPLKFCQEPATYESKLTGRLCARHAEEQRQVIRNPNTLGNVLAGGKARTEEQIAMLVRELPSKEKFG
jgi:hypothetical protein